MNPGRTSNSEHFEPGAALKDTNEADKANDPERQYGKSLCQLVHVALKRSTALLYVLHHAEDDAKLGL
jgi:hypothetical protein